MLLEAYSLLERLENDTPKGTVSYIDFTSGALKIILFYKDKISPKEGCTLTTVFSKVELESMENGIEEVAIESFIRRFNTAVDLRYNDMDQECDG